jgi:hypothetical protein
MIIMKNSISIENQYKGHAAFNKDNVKDLIRILTRFGTIPKITGINIIANHHQPEQFKITPGTSIRLGTSFLNNPVEALLYLRYAIEWQIWYRASYQDEQSPLLCDLASIEVLRTFYTLLPKKDKQRIEHSNDLLIGLIKDVSIDLEHIRNNRKIIAELQKFHELDSVNSKFDSSWEDIIRELAKPTEYLLMSGGDYRLNIDEDELLNKYGCRPFPRPEAFTFASSTATSVSNYAFDRTEKARTRLIKKCLKEGLIPATDNFSENLKAGLRKALEMDDDNQIIFSPSGTDSALQIAAITQIVSPDKEITHVLVASDESGSGVPGALKGKHFEHNTALNIPVKKGEMIEGFTEVDVIKILLRDENGILKSFKDVDQEVFDSIREAGAKNRHVVLHTMDQSKLGYQSPSEDMIEKLEKIQDLSLQIIVDASQLRLDSTDINNYLNKGYIVTITGSKFFTGPPYSGALIIPKNVSEKIRDIDTLLPKGLTQYYNESDWPRCWSCSKDLSKGYNYGTYMRWNAAIAEMERFFQTPLLYRNLGMEHFCNYVEESIKEVPFLEPLVKEEENASIYESEDIGLRTTRTIFPFFIVNNGKIMEIDKVKKLYLLLNSDISGEFKDQSRDIIRLASQKCHIGQAVSVAHPSQKNSAILRISLGARVISESWENRDISMFFRNVEEQLDQITVIIRKIELILNKPGLI